MNEHKVIMQTPDHWDGISTGSRAEKRLKPTCKRACAACGLKRGANGVDPCLGILPGVLSACCGHGTHNGYIAFENGMIIRGRFTAIEQTGDTSAMWEMYGHLKDHLTHVGGCGRSKP